MSGEEIRSIGCGPIGAFISAAVASLYFNWQVKHWCRWIPTKFGNKEPCFLTSRDSHHESAVAQPSILAHLASAISRQCIASQSGLDLRASAS
jgi:hypothetical protein